MSFFSREKSSLRKPSKLVYNHAQHYHDVLDGLQGDLSFGVSSGFVQSPYEMFRQNVAKYCERFMYSSFDQEDFLSAEEKSLRGLRTADEPCFDERLAEGDASWCARAETEGYLDKSATENSNYYCSSNTSCEHSKARPSKSNTNIFSVMSVSFEPVEDLQPKKPSLLKKLTHFMNSDFNSHKEKVTAARELSLRERCESDKSDVCECHIHIDKHSNCCQCTEAYYRANCECEQHKMTHSRCCRCDPQLLEEYDQHLKKKRYLRLPSDDEDLYPVNSVDYQEGENSRTTISSQNAGAPGERPCKEGYTAEESNGHHPCESCCLKLDNIYGTALREVHNMLMVVSKELLPSANWNSPETRVHDVSRLRPSFCQAPQNQEIAATNATQPERTKNVQQTRDVGVQVTPNADISEEHPKEKPPKRMKQLRNKYCLHLQLYRDSKDRYKQGQTKASLSLQHFLGVESGFTLDKESNTIAILCQDVTVVLAFDTRERLIQWQVKIASNLGEDQQYLIQIGSAPPKTKIAPGPARLHIQEYRFSLTMGVPPRLIGVWTISQLRRYGVVDNRFIFEGGSTCGRLEGVYVLVTDQGDEITKAFKAASEGKLIPKRKQVSRNSTVSVTESPRRRANSRVKSVTGSEQCEQPLPVPMWENLEAQDNSECGDTVSVLDLNMDTMPNEGWSSENAACQSCKVGNMPRSLTVFNTPGTGFNPAWIMEAISCGHESNRNTICCNASVISESRSSDDSGCRSRAVSPCGAAPTTCLVHENRTSKCMSHSSCESASYENYDTPRNICASVIDTSNRSSMTSSMAEEYYDTPKKIKENLHVHQHHAQPIQVSSCQPMPIYRHICTPAPLPSTCTRCHPPRHRCNCQVVQICSCQSILTCAPKPAPVACSCLKDAPPPCQIPPRDNHNHQPIAAAALYAKVDLLKKTKRKGTTEPPETLSKTMIELVKECVPNYENMGFAQSLEYYENLKDLRVRVDKCCVKCQSQHQGKAKDNDKPKAEEEYLVMGPVCERTDPLPPYLPMKPVDKCSCPAEQYKEPVSTQAQSVTGSPCLRRHDPTSCYATNERRRMAQIRRRSNSMDSGRYLDGVDINAKTSSSTHNTLTPNSQNNSVDSIPSQAATPKKVAPHLKPDINLADFRRPSSVPCKANRDSSASNDSGVSTGSLKNFGGGFLEFETIITPLSKVRQRSLDTMPLVLPRRSKSSDPLDELTFKFGKAEVKSSSAEAEVPICPPKKDCSKDISVSSSSGALTIPYIDSISSSSGASDMSDYIETLSMSSYSSSEHDNLRHCHSAVTFLRPRSGKEYQKIDRSNLEYAKAAALQGAQHTDSPSPGYVSSTSSN